MLTELRVFLLGDWVSILNRSMARSPGRSEVRIVFGFRGLRV